MASTSTSSSTSAAPRANMMKRLDDERSGVPDHDLMALGFLDVATAVVVWLNKEKASRPQPRRPVTRSRSSGAGLGRARTPQRLLAHTQRHSSSSLGDRRGASGSDRKTTKSPIEQALNRLLGIVDAFVAFRVTFSQTTIIVFRIAFIRRMFERLDELLQDLDGTVHTPGLQSNTEAGDLIVQGYEAWRAALVAARDKEEAELSVIAKKSTMPFARNVMGHEAMEALTLMKFEIDFYPAPRNTKLHVASMKAVFFSIVRSSNGRVTKIPDWYSPPYLLVSEDALQLPNTGFSTTNRAKWSDRHHDGAVIDIVAKRIDLDSEAIDAFRREVEIWYAINYPHVVKLLSASHCSSPTLLVLEDVNKGTLKEYVRRSSVHRHELFAKAREAALGLQYMREKHRIVHGNLKPPNILIGADGTAKVTDFGGGMVTLQNLMIQHRKQTDLMKWRAPEFQSYRTRPSYQADVFSLGLCIVDAIMDDFVVPTADQLARNGLRVRGLSDEAQALIDGMTAVNPDERVSLTEVIQKLGELAQSPSRHLDLPAWGLHRLGSRSDSRAICGKRLSYLLCRTADTVDGEE